MDLPSVQKHEVEHTHGKYCQNYKEDLSNAGEETTARKGIRGEDKVERNSSSKTGMWDGKDGLQLAWLGGWGLRKKELALNGAAAGRRTAQFHRGPPTPNSEAMKSTAVGAGTRSPRLKPASVLQEEHAQGQGTTAVSRRCRGAPVPHAGPAGERGGTTGQRPQGGRAASSQAQLRETAPIRSLCCRANPGILVGLAAKCCGRALSAASSSKHA
ncbi:hypothetical protein Anapl_01523 [Anas platyrhynchos]|uniref:Uncharacterized protein n=1 Tax=Anas platyrhynchos TaxID=8839 RepID=R0LJG2_ANAPL|nr:hypothetical protein Anapl_01523 [Anas platyrhynchos]